MYDQASQYFSDYRNILRMVLFTKQPSILMNNIALSVLLLYEIHFIHAKLTSEIADGSPHHLTRDQENEHCPLWFYYNTDTGNCECALKYSSLITCIEQDAFLEVGNCVTYDTASKLISIDICNYFKSRYYNVTILPGFIRLPGNISRLNDFMCAPLNRRGLICSECIENYGPSLASFEYECSPCNNDWKGLAMYFLFELFPITMLYLVIFVLRIDITSPPMPCFIMYSQLVLCGLKDVQDDSSVHRVIYDRDNNMRLGTRIILTLSGMWNLEFFTYFLPVFCVSSKLATIHLVFLDYLKVFYPLLLIIITIICIKLHDHNFRPFVCLWNHLQCCCLYIRKGWDTTNDIVNVFCSFFLLAYGKNIYQTFTVTTCQCLTIIAENGMEKNRTCPAYLDPNIDCWGGQHLAFVIPAMIFSVLCNILPALLLILYPYKPFLLLLSKCTRVKLALQYFVEKFHCHYKTTKRYTRSLSGLYFFLIIIVYTIYVATRHLIGMEDKWFSKGIIFWLAALIIGMVKPYKVRYANVLDSLILANLGIICGILSLPSKNYFNSYYVLIVHVMCLIPYAALFIYILQRVIRRLCQMHYIKNVWNLTKNFCSCPRNRHNEVPDCDTDTEREPAEQKPLISSTVIATLQNYESM